MKRRLSNSFCVITSYTCITCSLVAGHFFVTIIMVSSSVNRPLNSYLATRLGRTKQKKSSWGSIMNSTFLFASFPQSSELSMNFNISELVYWQLLLLINVAEMIKQLGEKHNLPLKTGFNATRGFFIQLTVNRDQDVDLSSLPSEFLKVVKVRGVVSFTTVDLVS